MTSYVAYYRVSTERQGKSGLGLAAQRSVINSFLKPGDKVISEFIEVQSGKNDTRSELWKAINHAKQHQAKILIAKLDRFSRKVSFIANIMEQGIGLAVADMPNATDFQLHIFAALAQEERRLISERTRNALAEAKKRGVILGKNGKLLAVKHHEQAKGRALLLAPIIRPLLELGLSYRAVAMRLNDQGQKASNGGKFYAQQIINIVRYMQDDQ